MHRKTRLVGRAAQQSELETVRRLSAAGHFRCVVMTGDPGVGKSRLAAEALSAYREGTQLVARAYPLGETSALGLWAEALEGHLRDLPAAEIDRLCGGFLDDLAALLRSVAAVRGSVPEKEPPRARLLQGLVALVGNLAQRSPVRVLLDDLHLADASSWEALHYLARNLAASSVLVLATARDAELESLQMANEVLYWLDKDGLLVRMPVTPLDRDAVAELAAVSLGTEPAGKLVNWLFEQSRGNTMFALSLLQALVEEGADLEAPHLPSLPDTLTGVVRSQLDEFDEPARATLELVALAGSRVEFDELARLSSRPPDRLEAILNQLLRSRLLAERESGQQFSYEIAQPLIREAIIDLMGLARRRSVHRMIGRALVSAGRLGAAAPHFASSAGAGDDEAVEVLTSAVRRAEEQEAFVEALTILNSLVEILPAGDRRWLEVVDALSWDADWVVDHRADVHARLGLEATRQIDRVLAGAGDPYRQAVVKFRLASFLSWGTGELDEAESQCRAAKELFEQAGDARSVLQCETELAWLASLQGRFVESADRAVEVMARAKDAGEMGPLMQAATVQGYQQLAMGEFVQGEEMLRRSAGLAEEQDNLYRVTTGLSALALNVALQGRIPEARELLRQAREVYPNYIEGVVLEWSAMTTWFAGDFPEVLTLTREALAANTDGLSRRRAYAVPFAAAAGVEVGLQAEAEIMARKAREIYGNRTWSFCSEYVTWTEALVLIGRERFAGAAPLLRRSGERLLSMQAWPWAAPVLLDEAEVAFILQDPARARQAATDLEAVADRVGIELYRGLALIGRGWAFLASSALRQAADAGDEAAGVLEGTGCRAFLGRALEVRGRALTPRRAEAVEVLERAAAVFDECGSVIRKERVLRILAELGTRGRRAAAGARGPESLTRREKEVVKLAQQGLTAKEIGEALFISARTVETHLSNAYAKLGVTSKMHLMGLDT